MASRFASFELDGQRAELRRRDGEVLKLRPKPFAMLSLFVTNPGRILTKQELMDAVWPGVHVGEDSLFQCIREIRAVLGDNRRELIRLVSGQGYLLAAEVTVDPPPTVAPEPKTSLRVDATTVGLLEVAPESDIRHYRVALSILGLVAVLALAAAILWSGKLASSAPPTLAVMPFASDAAEEAKAMAATVTTGLIDGLTKIENVHVMVQQATSTQKADFVLTGELRKTAGAWEARGRLTRVSNGEIIWGASVSIMTADMNLDLQQLRLVAGVGFPLALRLNEILRADGRSAATEGFAKAAIEQAMTAIKQTSRERFATAESILKETLADDNNNVDVAVALSALQLRGIQMSWYPPQERAAVAANSKSILKNALRLRPTSIAVLEAYCRLLSATNEFADSLVACARVLDFEPWDGMARYNLGLGQLQLGLFDDALATFKRAYGDDTPEVSRWTWRLGIGWAYGLMGRPADALPWVQSAVAITPASGRSLIFFGRTIRIVGTACRSGRGDETGTCAEAGVEPRQYRQSDQKRQSGVSRGPGAAQAGDARRRIAGALITPSSLNATQVEPASTDMAKSSASGSIAIGITLRLLFSTRERRGGDPPEPTWSRAVTMLADFLRGSQILWPEVLTLQVLAPDASARRTQ